MEKINLEKELCTACSACVSICPKKCIHMIRDNDGFNYPQIDSLNCIDCHMCEKVCPIINKVHLNNLEKAYSIKNKNENIRLSSTSGGVFSLLAEKIIEKKGYVVGASYDDEFYVKHIIIDNMFDISKLRVAKYSQSDLGDTFIKVKRLLDKGHFILFSGTPCQCEGLKSFLQKDYNNLITVDLICHGVPSPKVWKSYVQYRANKENNNVLPIDINMRSKNSGWSYYNYSTEFDYGDGKKTYIHNKNDLFMNLFTKNICLRSSCSNCIAKGVKRCSDFTLGDFWGIWNQHFEFDDNKGISAVLVHSEKGQQLLSKITSDIELIEVDLEDVYKENQSLLISSKKDISREFFLNSINEKNFEKIANKYLKVSQENKNVSFFMNIINKLMNLVK